MEKKKECFIRREELECLICLKPFVEPRLLPCMHYYCTVCLEYLRERHPILKCPTCMRIHQIPDKIEELPIAEIPARILENIREKSNLKNQKLLAEASELYNDEEQDRNLKEETNRKEKYNKKKKKRNGKLDDNDDDDNNDKLVEVLKDDGDIVTLRSDGGEINVIHKKKGRKGRAFTIWDVPAIAKVAKKKKSKGKDNGIMTCNDYYRCDKMRVGRVLDLSEIEEEESELNIVFDTRSSKISVTLSDAAAGLSDEDVIKAIKFAKLILAQKNPPGFPDVKFFDSDEEIIMDKYNNGHPKMSLQRVKPSTIVEPEKLAQSPVISTRQMRALKRRVKNKGKVPDEILERMGLLKREEFKGISFAPDGTIYVADPVNNAVRVYAAASMNPNQLKGIHSNDDVLQWPSDVLCLNNREIAIADTDNQRILICDTKEENILYHFGSKGSEIEQLMAPCALAYDSDTGHIYVADYSAHRVQIYTKCGNFVKSFGTEGSGNGEFKHPSGLALTAATGVMKYLLVSDSENHRIQVFNEAGMFLFTFGSFGSEEGQFNHPRFIRIDDNGSLLIADRDNNRVQVFTESFRYRETLGMKELAAPMCALYNNVTNYVIVTTRWKSELFIVKKPFDLD